jgi:hypothetical protein
VPASFRPAQTSQIVVIVDAQPSSEYLMHFLIDEAFPVAPSARICSVSAVLRFD